MTAMGFIRNTKTATLGADAAKAHETGQRYYTPVLNFPMSQPGLSGGIADWPPMIEAIEAAGWQLNQWQVATDKQGRPQAFPLFVRR